MHNIPSAEERLGKRPMHRNLNCIRSALCLLAFCATLRSAYGAQIDLSQLSLEELMNIEVVSAAKRVQKLSDVAAAVYVITPEEIRRSGATSIPEALRLVPGLSVARIDSNKWAISARGFNGFFANKLLILIDGRSVYTPLFSGVYWDVQDTLLEDIDRIEVVRGPAGALWGANAVNGVINIVTKNANDTQGGLLTAGGGNEERGFGEFRYGSKLGDNLAFRVYGKYFSRDNFKDTLGSKANDAWQMGRGGLRLDAGLGPRDSMSVQGDYYDGRVSDKVTLTSLTAPFQKLGFQRSPVSGGHLLGTWEHTVSPTADLRTQFYYDRTDRTTLVVNETRQTVDWEAQHSFAAANWHQVVWGAGYRYSNSRIEDTFTVSLTPQRRNDQLFSAFWQSEIDLIKNRLRLTLGSKLEHNDYSGFELQPNGRLAWTINPRNTFWGAISRAVRTPSQFEHDVRANIAASAECPIPAPCLMSGFGRDRFRSETLIAHELGYRSQINSQISLDAATFYNVYNDLRTAEPGVPFFEPVPPPPHLTIPFGFANNMDAEAAGIELSSKWTPVSFWKLALAYTWLKIWLHPDKSSAGVVESPIDGDSPEHQFHMRSFLDLPYDLQLDGAYYYVSRLAVGNVPAYHRVDLRLGYRPVTSIDLSLGVQNLFGPAHREFVSSSLAIPTKVERSFYGKITWRF
jgi:iron complex outermembrane receptor protein